jgi:hypothetical protein
MESNRAALAIVDGAFTTLERRIGDLDQLTDRQQLSRERIAEIDGEISQIKSDDSLERAKRVSRLTALNSSKEIARADDSRLVAAIVTAKARILASGRAVRNLISQIIFQLTQTRRLNATALLAENFEVRKFPLRPSDLANTAKALLRFGKLKTCWAARCETKPKRSVRCTC